MNSAPSRRAAVHFIEPLEARIAPAGASDLVAVFQSMTINGVVNPTTVSPGDTGEITVLVKNLGPDPIVNVKTCLNIWLTPFVTGSYGAQENKIVDGEKDILEKNVAVFNPSGTLGNPADGSYFVTRKFTVPDYNPSAVVDPTGNATHQDYLLPGAYHIVGEIDGAAESDILDFSIFSPRHLNNFGASPTIDYAFKFGTYPGHKSTSFEVRGASGVNETFTLKGNGSATLVPVGGGEFDLIFTGTDAKTTAGETAAKSATPASLLKLRKVTGAADGAMGSLSLPNSTISGQISFSKGLAGLTLGDVSGPGLKIDLGGTAGTDAPTKIILGIVTDMSLTDTAGIASLQVKQWNSPSKIDRITAPFITALESTGLGKASDHTGDFGAGLHLAGADAAGYALKIAEINGELNGNAHWDVIGSTHKIGKIEAFTIKNWSLDSDGPVGELASVKSIARSSTDGDDSLRALSFGKIYSGSGFSEDVTTTGVIAGGKPGKEVAIGKLDLGVALTAKIDATSGGITSIEVNEWAGTIETKWIGTLKSSGLGAATGDFGGDVTLTGDAARKEPTLGKATIDGVLSSGTWTVTGAIGSITARTIDNNFELKGTNLTLGKLAVLSQLAGKIGVNHLDSAAVAGLFSGSIKVLGEPTRPIKSLIFAATSGATIETDTIILKMSALLWNDVGSQSTIKADAIGTFKVFQTIANTTITLVDTLGLDQSMGAFTAHDMVDVQLSAPLGVGIIKTRSMALSTIAGGAGIIENFQVTGVKNDPLPNFTGNTVSAHHFGKVIVANVAQAGAPNTITAAIIESYARLGADGKLVIPKVLKNLTTPGMPDVAGVFQVVITP